MTVGITQVGVLPAPRHHFGRLVEADSGPFQMLRDPVEIRRLEIKTNPPSSRKRLARLERVYSQRARAFGGACKAWRG